MVAMRLVPRQLRKSGFPSRVPYYGGRMTPQQIAGLQADRPGAEGAAAHPGRAELLAALGTLHAAGVLRDKEHEKIARRIVDGT
jgi:hypothetical protein